MSATIEQLEAARAREESKLKRQQEAVDATVAMLEILDQQIAALDKKK